MLDRFRYAAEKPCLLWKRYLFFQGSFGKRDIFSQCSLAKETELLLRRTFAFFAKATYFARALFAKGTYFPSVLEIALLLQRTSAAVLWKTSAAAASCTPPLSPPLLKSPKKFQFQPPPSDIIYQVCPRWVPRNIDILCARSTLSLIHTCTHIQTHTYTHTRMHTHPRSGVGADGVHMGARGRPRIKKSNSKRHELVDCPLFSIAR